MNSDTIEKPSLDTLLDQNLHDLIACMASQFSGKYTYISRNSMITQEDLAQQGFFGAIIAYESFDATRGCFRTYAFPYIRNAMSTYCRKFSHPLSISEKAARDDWEQITDIGILFIDHRSPSRNRPERELFDIPVGSGVEISGDVDEYLLMGFTQRERDLIKGHIIDEYSLKELADQYHISKTRAGEIIRGLLDRMRVRAENYVKND